MAERGSLRPFLTSGSLRTERPLARRGAYGRDDCAAPGYGPCEVLSANVHRGRDRQVWPRRARREPATRAGHRACGALITGLLTVAFSPPTHNSGSSAKAEGLEAAFAQQAGAKGGAGAAAHRVVKIPRSREARLRPPPQSPPAAAQHRGPSHPPTRPPGRPRQVGQSFFTSFWTTLWACLHALLVVFRERPQVVRAPGHSALLRALAPPFRSSAQHPNTWRPSRSLPPAQLLCNGPGTCVPLVGAAVLMRIVRPERLRRPLSRRRASNHPRREPRPLTPPPAPSRRLRLSPPAPSQLGLGRCGVVYVESIARVQKLSLTGVILYRARLADAFFVQWEELAKKLPRALYMGRLM